MQPTTTDLSIIIVNWNTRQLLAECLRAIENSSDPSIETIVVDNASIDDSAAMVSHRFPKVRLIENAANRGFATANNQGIARATGRYMALLNSDTEVRPGALDTLCAFMEAQPRTGACGPRLLNADGSLQPSCHPMLTPEREFWRLMFLERLLPKATYPMDRWDPATPRRVEVIKGACLMLRREALDEVGPLDDSYFMYTEEVDLCHRLALAGWELWWEPRAEVVHHGGASSRQAHEAMYIELYRSKVQFHRKFGGQRRARRAKILLALAYVPRAALTAAMGAASEKQRVRSRLYRRFLREMSAM